MHIITMLLLLSVLILVHEFGHFMAARRLGIKVERFGFGLPFGPVLWEGKWGDTIVCVHAFLLGGYVSFPDDDPDSKIPKDSYERITNRPVWQRAIVISAGVTANAIMAYLLVLMVAGASGSIPANKNEVFVGELQQGVGLSVNQIGIQPDDKILSVNGQTVDSLYKFIETVKRSKKFNDYITYDRHEEMVQALIGLNPELPKESWQKIPAGTVVKLPQAGLEEAIAVPEDVFDSYKKYKPVGKYLSEEEKQIRSQIQGKDKYTSNGELTVSELAAAVGDTAHAINIVVEREGKALPLKPAFSNEEGIIGIKLKIKEIREPVKSPTEAIVKSWNYLEQNGYYMLKGLGMIVTGQIPLSDLHGIVAVTKIGSDIIENRGLWDGILLTALISLDLAIVNLLPIPALDGGHLMFLLIEKLRGRPVEEKTQEAFAKYGFMFLIGLMFLIIFNDIFALVTDKL